MPIPPDSPAEKEYCQHDQNNPQPAPRTPIADGYAGDEQTHGGNCPGQFID